MVVGSEIRRGRKGGEGSLSNWVICLVDGILPLTEWIIGNYPFPCHPALVQESNRYSTIRAGVSPTLRRPRLLYTLN